MANMKTKDCKDCKYFRTLFRRANYTFFVYNSGDCFIQHKPVDRYGFCEYWQEKEAQQTVTPIVLRRVINDLQEIKLILQEESERINKKQD